MKRSKLIRPPILSAIFLILLVSSCKDELPDYYVPGLPLPTENGNHIIGCLFNGEPWKTDGSDFSEFLSVWYDEDGSNVPDNKLFEVNAKNAEGWMETLVLDYLFFDIYPLENEGLIHANEINEFKIYLQRSGQGINPGNQSPKKYNLDTLYDNYLEITKLDTSANICAGRFSFRLIQEGNIDTLLLSEGRFDFKYMER